MAEYYTMDEARAKLGMSEVEIRALVVEGKLREFREGGIVRFRTEDIDRLSGGLGGLSQTGELVLEPAGSFAGGTGAGGSSSIGGLDLTDAGGGDLLWLADEEDKEIDKKGPKKDDTVVTSIGVSVFEEDELELDADPAAKTVLSGSGGAGAPMEGSGGGSGLLDLTRESDDTSLGAELLDEIYPDEGGGPPGSGSMPGIIGEATAAGIAKEMGGSSGTRAALPAGSRTGVRAGSRSGTVVPMDTGSGSGTALAMEDITSGAEAPSPAAMTVAAPLVTVEDPYAGAFTGVMLVTVFILALSGATGAAFLSGSWPAYLDWISRNIIVFGGAALAATVIVLSVGMMLARPKGPRAPRAERPAKPKKEAKPKPEKKSLLKKGKK